jgi:hypothetical protein
MGDRHRDRLARLGTDGSQTHRWRKRDFEPPVLRKTGCFFRTAFFHPSGRNLVRRFRHFPSERDQRFESLFLRQIVIQTRSSGEISGAAFRKSQWKPRLLRRAQPELEQARQSAVRRDGKRRNRPSRNRSDRDSRTALVTRAPWLSSVPESA